MAEEGVLGPRELRGEASQCEIDVNYDKNGDETDFNTEKLRQYQLNRLKYYYAVVTCDSKETANKLYEDCDGMEYETSSARLDLRFIPDDMTFDQTPKESCTQMPDLAVYKPSTFLTSALCLAKVDLTWDETDVDRVKMTMKKFSDDDLDNDALNEYIAVSSDDENSENNDTKVTKENSDESEHEVDESDREEDRIKKYKNLLQSLAEEEVENHNDVQLEISWEPNIKSITKDILKNKKSKEKLTPWEEYKQHKKEKKKQKKAEKKIEKSKLKGENVAAVGDSDAPPDAGFDDPFFSEELLDETDKKKKIKRKRRLKKKEEKEMSPEELEKIEKEKAELKLLMMDEDDNRHHFSLDKLLVNEDSNGKKKKKKKKKADDDDENVATFEDDFKMDLNDSRFEAVYKSHLFNIDPSAPEFKHTKAMKALIEEKLKKRDKGGIEVEKSASIALKRKVEAVGDTEQLEPVIPEQSMLSLVRSVKAKTELFQQRKKLKRKA